MFSESINRRKMKTKILNWDVNIQWVLIGLNLLILCLLLWSPYFIGVLLYAEVVLGIYQLTSGGVNLALNHKSAGFRSLRQWHLGGAVIFMLVIEHLNKSGGTDNMFIDLAFMVVVPQVVFHAYFILCRKELHYLQNREFFILR